MQQKYIYSYNGVFNWIRGLLPLTFGAERRVTPYSHPDVNFIWRNHFTQAYKVNEAFTQQPLDLSNFLFIRTRERLLL